MDGSGAGQGPAQNIQASQQASLIRPEQVKKLPHLQENQKTQYEQMVQRLWDVVNTSPQNSDNWNKAFARLSTVSKQLMAGMRQWQAQRQQTAAAAAQASAAGAVVAPQPNQPITDFSQLNPQIQQRVNSYPIVFPPSVKQGTQQAQDWLREARMRFGQALQRLEVGKQKMAELQKVVMQRKQAGQLSSQDSLAADTKFGQYKKTIDESNSFLQRFKAQQAQFKQERPQGQPPQVAVAPSTGPQIDGVVEAVNQNAGGQGPAAHTIATAVTAARNQANAAQAVASPTAPVPGQQQEGTPVSNQQKNQAVVQSPYNATSAQADLSGSAQAAIQQQQQMNAGGVPRPLSQSAAVQQAAQINAVNQAQAAQSIPQSATTVHGHPPYMQQTGFKAPDRMKISPQLNTKPHEPVQMPPARPTLTGGPSGGAIGQMGQPGIPKMPGYVLEGAGNERVLSKNKLNELVREVTGAGPEDGDQLSPESEEILLALADDFVDQLVTSACKLAKLRGQSTLDVRDIQVILERQYNIRIPGYSTDEIRTVRRIHPNVEYLQKMGAVQAAKVTGGGSYGLGGAGGKDA